MDPFVPGSLYDITYVLQSGNGRWYQWQMTAVFLHHKQDAVTDICEFSLRPKMGTTSFSTEYVQDVRLIKKDAGARTVEPWRINLPKRLVGAVPGPSDINRRTLEFRESW